jgi:hypothetical protein
MRGWSLTVYVLLFAFTGTHKGAESSALRQVQTIALANVEGRIDHMGVDLQGQRLFVSALGNNTLEVLDLREGRRLTTVKDLREPQGVLFCPQGEQDFRRQRR